jgi:hypothetical protein
LKLQLRQLDYASTRAAENALKNLSKQIDLQATFTSATWLACVEFLNKPPLVLVIPHGSAWLTLHTTDAQRSLGGTVA